VLCRLLGPLEFWADGDWTGLSAPKLRALLAVLLLRPGQVVSITQLVAELWGDDPPQAARKLVSGYVLRLRRLTGDPAGQVLVTSASGYRLLVAPGEIDVSRFGELVAAARAAFEEANGARAAELLDEALELWRGPPLLDVPPGPLVVAEMARLEEMRLDATELWVAAGMSCGRGAELVAELRQLTAGHPLRERFWLQLMQALEHSGRPAEALEVYGQVRAILAEELGTDPGPDLQQFYRGLLASGAAPATRPPAGESGRARPAVPLRQLPGTVAHFAGRTAELAMLTRLPDRPGAPQPGTVVISAIDGMPGVGKTALAVQAGHLLADRFPDGQLFVDLHGHTPGQKPADPADVLAGLLAADGVNSRYLPAGLDGRAVMWRDRMAGQRVLLILDNAASSAQVAPLLPGTAGCLVLVTSRRFLGDLPMTLDVSLDVLTAGEAAAMFTDLAPPGTAEPAQVAELVALCGHLPLAISLLGRLLTRHRSWRMADLIGETRARLLTIAAENQTVAAAFEVSYQDLDRGQQRFFRQLALYPGADIDVHAAAALTGLPADEASRCLDTLHGCRLVEEPVPRRYRMHDLIRQYARDLASRAAGDEREQAVRRLLDYYQHTAEAADTHLRRHSRGPAVSPVPAPAAAPALPGYGQAQAWMTAERANLVACIDHAIGSHDHARVTGLTAAIAAHLRSDGPWPQAATLHAAAARAAREYGDQAGHANALVNLGDVRRLTGDYPGAIALLEQARDICRRGGDRLGHANALFYLADVNQLTGRYPDATSLLEQARGTYRDAGDRLGQANALLCLGTVRRLTGHYPDAISVLEQAAGLYRGIGQQPGESLALLNLGAAGLETDEYADAARVLEQARDISRSLGDRLGEANALLYLATIRHLTGDYPVARGQLEQSLEIARGIGNRLGQANALCRLGGVLQGMGDYPGATSRLAEALTTYRDIGDRLGEANTLIYLGTTQQATGDFAGAARRLDQARASYREIGNRLGEAEAMNLIAAMHLVSGSPQRARAQYQRALELARAIGSQLEEAHALEGIGRCAAPPPPPAASTASTGRDALRQALEIYQRIGAADAPRLAAELAGPRSSDRF
jgi:DNA-binding SARP family transcriptional activator/tetratricopeptide (TPR) repeat protein